MKKTFKFGLAIILVISSLLIFGMMAMAETDTVTVVNSGNLGTKIDYDTETKTMTFTYVASGYGELQPVSLISANWETLTFEYDYSVQNFIDKYRTEVEHIEIGYFGKIQYVKARENGTGNEIGIARLFQDMANLKSVHFAKNQRIAISQKTAENLGGVFANCPLLTTVWFGDETNKIEGCVNFTDADIKNNDAASFFPINLLKNCASVESVIFYENPNIINIDSTTFSGCASLKEVTIGSNITTIADDAFENTGVLRINAPEGSAAANVELPSLLERIEAYKANNEPVNEGYCGVSQTVDGVLGSYDSNVKWEIYNLGTYTAPYYTIYFYIDSTSSNTSSTTITSFANIAYAPAKYKGVTPFKKPPRA